MKITVPTCHIEKLKSLGIYDQWLANIKEYMNNNGFPERSWSGGSWGTLIESSFNFNDSPEGYDFWEAIAES